MPDKKDQHQAYLPDAVETDPPLLRPYNGEQDFLKGFLLEEKRAKGQLEMQRMYLEHIAGEIWREPAIAMAEFDKALGTEIWSICLAYRTLMQRPHAFGKLAGGNARQRAKTFVAEGFVLDALLLFVSFYSGSSKLVNFWKKRDALAAMPTKDTKPN